jgi:hypothetical protein
MAIRNQVFRLIRHSWALQNVPEAITLVQAIKNLVSLYLSGNEIRTSCRLIPYYAEVLANTKPISCLRF